MERREEERLKNQKGRRSERKRKVKKVSEEGSRKEGKKERNEEADGETSYAKNSRRKTEDLVYVFPTHACEIRACVFRRRQWG